MTTSACHPDWSVEPGSGITILSGTYATTSGVSLCGATVDNPLGYVNGVSATEDAPVVIQAQSGARFERLAPAPDASQSLPLVNVHNSSYLTLDGLQVAGMKGRSDYHANDTSTVYGEVDISDARSGADGTHITLRNMQISHSNFTCIKQEDDESYDTFSTNVISDCGAPGNTQEHGIYLSGGFNTVSDNTISNTSGYGIHTYQTSAVRVDHETITGNTVSGACLSECADIYVYEGPTTVSQNTVSGAYIGIEAWANGGVITINQNVVRANPTAGLVLHADVDGAYSVLNNTFYRNGFEDIGQAGTGSIDATLENNIFSGSGEYVFNPGGSWSRTSAIDYNDYYLVNGTASGVHSLGRDPMFVNPTAGNFHLQPASPAIGAGTFVGLPFAPPAPNMGSF